MRTKKTLLSFIFLLSFYYFSFSQKTETRLALLGDTILKGTTDSIRIESNRLFYLLLDSCLKNSESFSYSFEQVKNLGVHKTDDDKVKIYTWILPLENGNRFNYNGFIQYKNKKGEIKLFALTEKETDSLSLFKKSQKPDEWYGALYYQVIEKKYKKRTYYTLLGWKGNNRITTKKVIDVLTFEKDEPKFGAPVFQYENKKQTRVIFEFNAQAVMTLRYDDRYDMIVFDDLQPKNSSMKGQFQYYGPNFRYNGLKFKKGLWVLNKDIDVRNPRDFDQPENKKEIKSKNLYEPQK